MRRYSRRALVALVAYGIALFWINHVPRIGVSVGLGAGKDKVAHFLAYGLFAFLLAWTLFPGRRGTLRGYLVVLAVSAAYGAMDELLQKLVPNRSAEWMDWFADIMGAAVALIFHAMTADALSRMRSRMLGRRHEDEDPEPSNGPPVS